MQLPKPKQPIDCITISHRPIHESILLDGQIHAYPCGYYVTTMKVETIGEIGKQMFDALFEWSRDAGFTDDSSNHEPTKVIINEPATVLFFDDDTKVVAKAKDGDEYNPLFGIMDCALRKVGKNRVTVDLWEPVIKLLADNLADADECRLIADMLGTTADALELDGVMDELERYDVRKTGEGAPSESKPLSDAACEASKSMDDERTRQVIRDLIDRGEL